MYCTVHQEDSNPIIQILYIITKGKRRQYGNKLRALRRKRPRNLITQQRSGLRRRWEMPPRLAPHYANELDLEQQQEICGHGSAVMLELVRG